VLSGIINGVDYNEWNPEIDQHLPMQYTVATYQQGKAECKAALQRELGLAVRPDRPLIALIGRLADQKGLDLVATVLRDWVRSHEAQWVILGTGEPRYHELLSKLAAGQPHQVAAKLEFSDPLAHRIEAGADIFLMPSRYEPCGLSQLYSLKYGTVPVVRATGGLVDTITNATSETLAAGTANGFMFQEYSAMACAEALRRACDTYQQQPEVWRQLVTTGMQQDWSWSRSAKDYVSLYQQMLSNSRRLSLV
jgi:starch synthase